MDSNFDFPHSSWPSPQAGRAEWFFLFFDALGAVGAALRSVRRRR